MYICFQAIVMTTAFLAGVTSAQIINEDLKLLASDGAALDELGFASAIDEGIVAVGA